MEQNEMKQLTIKKLGPIEECSIFIKPFNVVTGKQSSGKSTIAKCLFYFLTLNNELYRLVYAIHHPGFLADGKEVSLATRFRIAARNRFYETFGYDVSAIKDGTNVRMKYSEGVVVSLTFGKRNTVYFSQTVQDLLKSLENQEVHPSPMMDEMPWVKSKINEIFHIDYSSVYIPAGRSIMTVLGNQFSLFYSTLDDNNRRLIDLCTRNYLETVMRLKPLFNNGFQSLKGYGFQEDVIYKAQGLIQSVMNSEYHYSNGNEFLVLTNGKRIGINNASSGQQEALWIYNILLYYMIVPKKTFFIIEEPESNLFPESQQLISKYLGFISNGGFPMLINTHSPYVLGELNNMIYAGSFKGKKQKQVSNIIEKECQLQFQDVQALFVEDGIISDCMDYELEQIDNAKLDSISTVINSEYDALLEIERD